ncbi:MAG: hypothetical protein CL693_15910 [Cellvibrionaceae bacterium]|nr:hypothetical protein [Cellvibrionaceae bacterium]MAZ89114.1 hypothetical protein [Cellvibrionaceae bacterium]|tara:strand:+ start:14135 stop:15331 length:1197 start_codon:yes stop_codon:yes gene_type:complete
MTGVKVLRRIQSFSLNMILIGLFFSVSGFLYIDDDYSRVIYLTVILFSLLFWFLEFPDMSFSKNLFRYSFQWRLVTVFFLWVFFSSLINEASALKVLSRLLAIYFFLYGVALARMYRPKEFYFVLLLGVVVAVALLCHSTIGFYSKNSLTTRLVGFGMDVRNPVVVGVVAAGLSVMAYVLARTAGFNRVLVFLLKLIALSLFVICVFSWSKTPFLGLLAGLVFYFLIVGRAKGKRLLAQMGGVIVVVTALMWLSDSWRLADVDALMTLSNRLPIWLNLIDSIKSNFFFGVGIDSDAVFEGENDLSMEHPHNSYLQAWYYTGWLGFLLFTSIYLYPVWSVILSQGRGKHLLWCFGFVFGVQLVDVHVFLSRPNLYWFILWLPVGWFAIEEMKSKQGCRT